MEEQIRAAAFEWLKNQTDIYGDVLPRSVLIGGFVFDGYKVTLMSQRGIWKPGVFQSVPISITTTENNIYNDHLDTDGSMMYHYMGSDPNHRDNAGLREAMINQIPLIYFIGVAEGKYIAEWPVYIVGEDSISQSFKLLLPAEGAAADSTIYDKVEERPEYAARSYITAEVLQRIHQKSFRERVLRAYSQKCAFCMLRHEQLLDAAHIIPDGEDRGEPIVINGLSLCKIHHAAYDNNILGVTPGYIISVRDDILIESDGPMLKHGIQELNNIKILLPDSRKSWPDKERLEIRYKRFREAG
jgi:putative restriction endonuclease